MIPQYLYITVNGKFTPWSIWGPCSKSCGEGEQKRTRLCSDPPPSKCGNPCIGDVEETTSCNTHSCPGKTEDPAMWFISFHLIILSQGTVIICRLEGWRGGEEFGSQDFKGDRGGISCHQGDYRQWTQCQFIAKRGAVKAYYRALWENRVDFFVVQSKTSGPTGPLHSLI